MRVSFDLDDTLVCRQPGTPRERGLFPAWFPSWFSEPLRRGTRMLMRELRSRGCSIWIYTTSERSPFYVRFWLLLYGIRVDGVVNGERHRREVTARSVARKSTRADRGGLPSKYPPAFGIDLHVDDSEGVRIEGHAHGFRVVIVRPDDEDWALKVLDAIDGTHT